MKYKKRVRIGRDHKWVGDASRKPYPADLATTVKKSHNGKQVSKGTRK